MRDKILLQLSQLKARLNETSRAIEKKYSLNLIMFGAVEISVGLIYVVFLIAYFVPQVIKVREVGRGYFKILPKSTLEKIAISSYIKEINLLGKIGYL